MREHTLKLAPALPAEWTEPFILAGLVFAITCMSLGVTWDVHWHAVVGRESFWTPPHLLLYCGVVLAELLGLFSFCCAVVHERAQRGAVRVRRLLTAWFGSVAFGSVVMLIAAGFDVAWHRTIGDRTIWSPPHVLGIAGALIVALATIVALMHICRRGEPSFPWFCAGARYLMAAFLVVPYFGLLPAAIMVFHPGGAGLKFVVTTPYLVAGLASLMMSGIIICFQQLLGEKGFEATVMMSLVLWALQEFFHFVATPPVAHAYGYFISGKRWNFPGLQFELLVLGFVMIPALAINRLPVRQPRAIVPLLAALYTLQVAVWLSVVATARGVAALPMLSMVALDAFRALPAVLALGAISSAVGVLCSRWMIQGTVAARDSEKSLVGR